MGKQSGSNRPGDLVRKPRPAPTKDAKRDAGGGSRDAVIQPVHGGATSASRGPEVGLPDTKRVFGKG